MNAGTVVPSCPYEAVDAYIGQQMRRLNIPGVALAVVEGDQVVYERGYGRARPGGEPPSSQTPFVLGSTTKSITALAVMQLVEAGKVDLDAPVQRYLAWFRVADPDVSASITVRHLLNQTSGLPMLPGMTLLANLDQDARAAERQVRDLATLELSRAPGAGWEYSNLNYMLLGLIIEAASGESYPDYIQHHIFDPLGMGHSFTSLARAKEASLAVGHRNWFGYPLPVIDLPTPRGSLAAGELISCSQDMARYLIAMLNGGRCGDAQILSPAGIAELQRGVVDYGAMGEALGQYAMGWFVDQVEGTRLVYHEGNVPEFSTFTAILPEQKKGVVLLFNSHLYGLPMVVAEVGKGLALLLAGHSPAPQGGFAAVVPKVARALPLIPLLQIAGVFATLRLVHRWQRAPALRPSRGRLWGRHVLLPLVPNLPLIALPLVIRSLRLGGYLALFNPDIAWIARICGGFAAFWALARAILILRQGAKP